MFLEDHGFDNQRVAVLKETECFDAAAEVYVAKADFPMAIQTFLLSNTDASTRKAASCLLGALQRELPLGVRYWSDNESVERLLGLSGQVNLLEDELREVCRLTQPFAPLS